MKLCIDCKHSTWRSHWALSNGKYICDNILNSFKHPVDGLGSRLRRQLAADGAGTANDWLRHGRALVGATFKSRKFLDLS